MESNFFYSTEEYHTQEKEKWFDGIRILDLRYVDEFELLFLTTTFGQIRFGKKFNPENPNQLNPILFENFGYSGIINQTGKFFLKEGIEIKQKEKQSKNEENEKLSDNLRRSNESIAKRKISIDNTNSGNGRNTGRLLFDEGESSNNRGIQTNSQWLESLRSSGNHIEGNAGDHNSGRTTEIRTERKNTRNYSLQLTESTNGFSKSSKLEKNIQALEILVTLQKENRQSTAEEKNILANFSGFGGLAEILYEPGTYAFQKLDYSTRVLFQRVYNLLKEIDPDSTKGVLKAVKSSSHTAYYTPPDVCRGIYDILATTGYDKGDILEPSLGTGVFWGTMPEQFRNFSNLYGVEQDYITGHIAKELYPDATIHISGLQDSSFPKNRFDVIIGNIPFGDIRVFDPFWKNSALPIYKFSRHKIHNYFVVKTLELAREGGIIALITSSATLDTPGNEMLRTHIQEEAEFLGAIRLPYTTFKNNNTEVTTDILFLRKFYKGEEKIQKHNFVLLKEAKLKHKNSSEIYSISYNEYFHEHPEMLLGIPGAGGQYRAESFILLEDENTVTLRERIAEKAGNIIAPGYKLKKKQTKQRQNFSKRLLETYTGLDQEIVKEGNIVIQEGEIGFTKMVTDPETKIQKMVFDPATFKESKGRIAAFIRLRTSLNRLMLGEFYDKPENELNQLRKDLNENYEKFTSTYNALNAINNEFIRKDCDVYTILALEKTDKNRKVTDLADIFYKRTINPQKRILKAESPEDAIFITINECGYIDPVKMAQLLGNDWVTQTTGLIFEIPEQQGSYAIKEKYLSGNVRKKLKQAEAAASLDSKYNVHVAALKAVQPQDIPTSLIDMRLGARWIPPENFTDFFKELFSLSPNSQTGKVLYNPASDEYRILRKNDISEAIKTIYAAGGKDGIEIAEAALQDKYIKIFYKDPDGNSIFNAKASQAANQKVEKIKEAFQKWLFKDKPRHEQLARIYNDTFNCEVKANYKKFKLSFPGYMGPPPRPHQTEAVVEQLFNNGGGVDHIVGAGKTLVMILTAMEMRRTGIANKPLILELKSVVPQIAGTFRSVYPFAKVLAPTEKDFLKENRKKLLSKIAINDWDCVILSYEQYCALRHEVSIETALIQEEIAQLRATAEGLEADKDGSTSLTKRQIKSLEKRIDNLITKIKEVLSRPQDEFTFEKLGIDHIFVDESHFFKNLAYSTKHSNVAGLGVQEGSQKTKFLQMGCRAIQEKYGADEGITFLSGTTITNSLVELYSYLRYLTPRDLQEKGIVSFDAWASIFTERTSEVEFSVTGELKIKDRFRKFTNVPELAAMYSRITNVKNEKNLVLPKPKLDVHLISTPLSEKQKYYMEEIIYFAKHGENDKLGLRGDRMKKAKMLVATGLSAKVAMDIRLLDPKNEDEDTSKISVCARQVARIYKESREHKGVQLIFSDLGTPSDKFNVYDELKRKLVETYNIPAHEIAFVHSAKNDKQRLELFKKLNDGELPICLASTPKMGTGVNVQEHIIAMHHLDVPWTPAFFEQRNGRGARQGNEYAGLYNNNKVQCYVYAAERSLDAYKYQLLEIKQNMINQIKDGSIVERFIDEGASDDTSMGFAEFVAQLSGNPLILEKANVDKDIHKLYTAQRIFEEEKFRTQMQISQNKIILNKLIEDTSRAEKDLSYFKEHGFRRKEDNSYQYFVEIDGISYNKPSEAGKALLQKIENNQLGKVLSAYGVDMYFSKTTAGTDTLIKYTIIGPSGLTFGNKEISMDPTHAGMSIISAIEQAERLVQKKQEIPEVEKEITFLQENIKEEWEDLPKLEKLLARQKEISRLLEKNDNQDNQETIIDIPYEEVTERETDFSVETSQSVSDIDEKTEENSEQEEPLPSPEIQKKFIGEHNPEEIVTVTQSTTKSGSPIWLASFGITFEYSVYKKKVEPLFTRTGGFWNKSHKAVIFKNFGAASAFKKNFIPEIVNGRIPFQLWKTQPKPEKQIINQGIKI